MSRDCDAVAMIGRCGLPAEFRISAVTDEGHLDGHHRAACGNGGHLRQVIETLLADGAPSVDVHHWGIE